MAKHIPGRPGWVEGTVEELLGLEPWESELIELRLALADAVRERRSRRQLTQKQLAQLVGSSQPRVAKMERAEASFDAMLRAMFALGAKRADLGRVMTARRGPSEARRRRSRAEPMGRGKARAGRRSSGTRGGDES